MPLKSFHIIQEALEEVLGKAKDDTKEAQEEMNRAQERQERMIDAGERTAPRQSIQAAPTSMVPSHLRRTSQLNLSVAPEIAKTRPRDPSASSVESAESDSSEASPPPSPKHKMSMQDVKPRLKDLKPTLKELLDSKPRMSSTWKGERRFRHLFSLTKAGK